jgi:hypothetical protein
VLLIPLLHTAEAQQGQRTYKYRCTIVSPPELVRRWVAQRGDPTTPIMFDMQTRTVFVLGGRFPFTTIENRAASWTYENVFTHQQMTGRFDGDSHEMDLEDAHWRCVYEGPGP